MDFFMFPVFFYYIPIYPKQTLNRLQIDYHNLYYFGIILPSVFNEFSYAWPF